MDLKQWKLNKRHRNLLLWALVAMAFVAVVYILGQFGVGIPCIFHVLTGLDCPGCGNTRAAQALMRLDFAAAFGYNLLFPVEFGYLAWVIILSSIRYLKKGDFSYRPPFLPLDITVGVLVIAWGIIRNFL